MSGGAAQKETAANTRLPHQSGLQRDVQELFFATLRREWSSLVLVPTHPGGGAAWVAEALADVAASLDGRAVRITPHGALLAPTRELIPDLTVESPVRSLKPGSDRWRGGQTIIAIDPVTSNPGGIAVALAADAVLLCVELGKTSIAVARRTIELIGRERFIGCVVLR
jgi:hypothetical protein